MPAFYQVQEPGLLFALHNVPDLQGITLAASSSVCLKHFALLGILRRRISNLVLLPFFFLYSSFLCIYHLYYLSFISYLSIIYPSIIQPSINQRWFQISMQSWILVLFCELLSILMVGCSLRLVLRSLVICPHIERALDPFFVEGWQDFSVSCILF